MSCCKVKIDCYKGEDRSEDMKLFTISRCLCNCHVLYGKSCGCCSDCCKFMDFEVTPGRAASMPFSGVL